MNLTAAARRATLGRAASVLSIVALAVGACVGGPSGQPRSPATPSPVAPSPTAEATLAPTLQRTPEPTPEPTLEPPPAAVLVVAGVDHPGEVGSYVWAGGSDSAPWLPAKALEPATVPGDASAAVSLDPTVDIATWTARVARADDETGDDAAPLGSGSGQPVFDIPAAGSWVVSVHATFAGGLGDATWYWHVVIR